MAHERFFYSELIDKDLQRITVEGQEHHHLSTVLRKKAGEMLHVSDGKGNMYVCEIESIDKQQSFLKIIKTIPEFAEEKRHIHLAVGIIRDSHWEWMLEKAVELGVSEITPLLTQNVIKRKIKKSRQEKIIITAAKQSGRSFYPILNEPVKFTTFIEKHRETGGILFDNQDDYPVFNRDAYSEAKKLILLVGPEGGFSKQEVDFAEKNAYLLATLGVRRLRTETACIFAVSNVISL